MTVIAAKPTLYRGVRFRSRLEARWAVCFDALGIEWTYEPAFPVFAELGYQPDFLLDFSPRNLWLVEVKPWPGEPNDWAKLADYLNSVHADDRYASVARRVSLPMVLFVGTPGVWEQGRLTGYGAVAVRWVGDEQPRELLEWAECPQCQRVDLWRDGAAMCCDRRLPTGPLYQAFGRVRDHSYEDA